MVLPAACPAADIAESGAPAGQQVVLKLESSGEFEVLHSRAETTATGLVLFGLIGYGIEESSRASEDKKREDAILIEVPEDVCHNHVVEAMTQRLAEKEYSLAVVDTTTADSSDNTYVIRLKIDACGYRKINTTTDEISAFFAAEYQILNPGEKASKKLERLMITGSERKQWDDLVGDLDSAVEEFRLVKIKAGRRLANKLIYMNR